MTPAKHPLSLEGEGQGEGRPQPAHSDRPLVLASSSPRRRDLLSGLGLPFEVIPSGIDEPVDPSGDPVTQATALAAAKAQEVAGRAPGRTIVAADTMVVSEGRILGKPDDNAHAAQMLRELRGREHTVVTGLTVNQMTASRATAVRMRDYSDAEIDAYVATGDPMDKAGSYAIQHPTFRPVASIDGCYCNVVGLPLGLLASLLNQGALASRQPLPQCQGCPDWPPLVPSPSGRGAG